MGSPGDGESEARLCLAVPDSRALYSDHEPAVRLYKRFGFTIEGTLVRYAYRAGQYVDVYTMARFKQE